jgi:glutathione S-transferase
MNRSDSFTRVTALSAPLEEFVLRSTLTSPFGRKVRIAIDILGLSDRVTLVPADTMDEADTLRQQNPLGKIPCLVRSDGTGIYDSGVILEFLQDIAGSDRLLPPRGPARVQMLMLAGLADGIIDAGAVIIYERRFHPEEAQSEPWLALQRGKILRALAAFEAAPPDPGQTNAATIGLACALGFLDKRKPVPWRPVCPRLVAWLAGFAANEPAFDRTSPPGT